MSGTRRKSSSVSHPHICAYCLKTITGRYPPYLVNHIDGNIAGPFHAACAKAIVDSHPPGQPSDGHIVGWEVARGFEARERPTSW